MAIDKRIQNLSYSSLLTLHKCPRKFQLYRLNSKAESSIDLGQSITFAYGHIIGSGIQSILENKPFAQTMWGAFLEWDVDLFASNDKQNKSFWGAIHALRQFAHIRETVLQDWELVYYEGKPACELSFSIALPNGFIYRGFVDAVLRNRKNGKVMVLECKTHSGTAVNPAQYKNSAQAIGYSIVLDAIFPDLSSYEVLYLVYSSKQEEYTLIPFEKSYYARALWIRELLLDVEAIKMYEEASIYPMRGESCFDFYRECEYIQHCTLSTEHLVSPLTLEHSQQMDAELEKFQIKITIEDLIASQLSKNVSAPATPVLSGNIEDEML